MSQFISEGVFLMSAVNRFASEEQPPQVISDAALSPHVPNQINRIPEVFKTRWQANDDLETWLHALRQEIQPALIDLKVEMDRSFGSTLAMRTDAHRHGRTKLIRMYTDDLNRIADSAQAWNMFWQELITNSVELRPLNMPCGEEQAAEAAHSLLKHFNYRIINTPSILTTDLLVQDARDICEALAADLVTRFVSMIKKVFDVLHAWHRKGFIGSIHWANEDTCDFTYFTLPVIYLGTERPNRPRATHKYQNRYAYHHHVLMNAQCLKELPDRSQVPDRISRVIDAIPPFLKPFVNTVEGLLVNGRVVEIDSTRTQHEEDRELKRPSVETDPAIVLGPYVLAGWKNSEASSQATNLGFQTSGSTRASWRQMRR